MPHGLRWWDERIREYGKAKADEWGEDHAKYVGWILRRFPREIWGRVAVRPPPLKARSVTVADVRALKDSPEWAPKTRCLYLQALRGYLRFEGCSLAEKRGLWALDGTPLNRRWLTKEQLLSLWDVCPDVNDRLIVAAAGWNGLRRVEVLRLRVRDLSLSLPGPQMRIWGKGRNGGKYRTIPVSMRPYGVLVEVTHGKRPEERVFPWGRAMWDERLARLGKLAGIPFHVSGHALRRTFGRLAFDAGTPLASIQGIYGHASPAMTVHYIGIDSTRMAEGLALFERFLETEAV